MISHTQAQKLAAQSGVPAETIEKDYLIELILFYLGRDEYLKETLVFRGGTALKKIYFPAYRFSEDLDFLIPEQVSFQTIEQKLEALLTNINADYPFRLTQRAEIRKGRLQSFINYDIIPEIRLTKQLKVDILSDDNIPGYQTRKIAFTYSDFNQTELLIPTYNLESVVSDKICRILGPDKEARDIFDLWYLLKLDLDVNRIKEELRNKFGHDIYLPHLIEAINREEYRRTWKSRLANQIADLPEYDLVVEELTEIIKAKLLNT